MFEYYYSTRWNVYIVTVDREQEVARFDTEEAARQFCDENNTGQAVPA